MKILIKKFKIDEIILFIAIDFKNSTNLEMSLMHFYFKRYFYPLAFAKLRFIIFSFN
jgi:hypothetical protein